jgi:hypothetical protein
VFIVQFSETTLLEARIVPGAGRRLPLRDNYLSVQDLWIAERQRLIEDAIILATVVEKYSEG